ncbi:MAG: peptide-methionine (R)-S-oxide reductase [Pseudomonadota bacterium]
MQPKSTRRAFIGSSVMAGAALPFGGTAQARPERTSNYVYEIERTEEEWRSILSDFEYEVLRNSGTEWAKTSELWDDYRDGEFYCKGCGLHVYSSEWRVELDKGWVFFSNAQPTNVLMDIDKAASYSMSGASSGRTMIEAHCRRCGSHLGHILMVDGKLVHCINGISLKFEPTAA